MNTPQEFAALLAALRSLPGDGGGAALATLTRTAGSTFRRAGARMLVMADAGRVVRGLSAGCPEQDIAMRAREALQDGGSACVLRYDRDHHGDVLMELGCGGELEVLIEPFSARAGWHFAEVAAELLGARRSGVLATLYSLDGRVLARPTHWLWSEDQARVELDEIADAAITGLVLEAARSLPARHRPGVLTLDTASGPAEVLIERLLPPPAAWLFGVNATSLALARTLDPLGWDVTVVDHRAVATESPELLGSIRRHHCETERAAGDLPFDARSFAVVMSHNLERDIAYLQALRDVPLPYLGAIGARRRAAKLFEATGLDASRLRSPCGLDIGSETPEEIALAIAAEMLSVANGTSGAVLSAIDAPIHR